MLVNKKYTLRGIGKKTLVLNICGVIDIEVLL
jgi:hypothetical protein